MMGKHGGKPPKDDNNEGGGGCAGIGVLLGLLLAIVAGLVLAYFYLQSKG